MSSIVTISHWLPVITFCPVNNLPDLIHVYVTIPADKFVELYGVRKDIQRNWRFRKMFMEDVAKEAFEFFDYALAVEVRLLTGRHVVRLEREPAFRSDTIQMKLNPSAIDWNLHG